MSPFAGERVALTLAGNQSAPCAIVVSLFTHTTRKAAGLCEPCAARRPRMLRVPNNIVPRRFKATGRLTGLSYFE